MGYECKIVGFNRLSMLLSLAFSSSFGAPDSAAFSPVIMVGFVGNRGFIFLTSNFQLLTSKQER